jgi:hypothetical protein
MRDARETVVIQIAAKMNHLLAMAGWAKPATSTAEGEEILKVAIGAVYTCETLFKITTLKVLPDSMGNYRAEEAIFTKDEIVVTILEFLKCLSNSCHNGDFRVFCPDKFPLCCSNP